MTANSTLPHIAAPAIEAGVPGAPIPVSEGCTAAYRECLDALRLEIANAIEAIAANALDRLQASISKQEALCFRLQILAAAGAASRGPTIHGAAGQHTAKLARTDGSNRESCRLLEAITVEYAAVLKHSGKTITLLNSLCQGYRGAFPSVSGGESDRPMWFCEA